MKIREPPKWLVSLGFSLETAPTDGTCVFVEGNLFEGGSEGHQ